MQRGEVYECRFDPIEGTEQGGIRPGIIVSRDSLNETTERVIVVPVTTFRGRELFPNQFLLRAPEGGISGDSVVLCEQVRAMAKSRLLRRRGAVSTASMREIDRSLAIALALTLASER